MVRYKDKFSNSICFLARSFNFTFRYIYDVLSLNNSRFGEIVDRIYPIELEIKDTTDTDRSASYLDLHLEIDSEGRLRTKFYDKRDDFNFPIVNFPFICSNIPAAPAYGVYISQMIRFSRACGFYQDFLVLYVLSIVVCPLVLFLLAIVLSVLLRYTVSDYPFGIFKLFLYHHIPVAIRPIPMKHVHLLDLFFADMFL